MGINLIEYIGDMATYAKILIELFLIDVDVLTRKMLMSYFGGNYYLKRCQRCSAAFNTWRSCVIVADCTLLLCYTIISLDNVHNGMCWISQAETDKIGMQWLSLRVRKRLSTRCFRNQSPISTLWLIECYTVWIEIIVVYEIS